jgi:hypothetical protein
MTAGMLIKAQVPLVCFIMTAICFDYYHLNTHLHLANHQVHYVREINVLGWSTVKLTLSTSWKLKANKGVVPPHALVASHWATPQHSHFNPKRTNGTDWIAGLFGPRTSLYFLEEGKSLTPAGKSNHPAHSLVTSQTSYLFWGNKTELFTAANTQADHWTWTTNSSIHLESRLKMDLHIFSVLCSGTHWSCWFKLVKRSTWRK